MKKIIIITVLALLLILNLTACDSIEEIIGEGGGVVITPTPGEWSERVFTSEYMGFRFALPTLWDAPTVAEWTALMEAGAHVLEGTGLELPEEQPVLYMVARNLLTGANVQITYHRYGRRTPSVDEIIDATSEELTEAGVRVVGNRGSIRLGDYDWTYISTELNLGDIVSRGRQFYNVYSGYIRIITVTVMTGVDELHEIIQIFIGSEERTSAVAIEFSEELIDSWVWFDDFDFIYSFAEDGTGVRGFSDMKENFQWRTSGDILLIEMDIGVEGWTFTVEGDFLTLDSLQEQGLSSSYLRIGAMFDDSMLDSIDYMLYDWFGHYDWFDRFVSDFREYGGYGDFGNFGEFRDAVDFEGISYAFDNASVDMEIVGIWLSYGSDDFFMIFTRDGYGFVGIYPNLMEIFKWGAKDGNHLVKHYMSSLSMQNWLFTTYDEFFVIESLNFPGITRRYVRLQ
ncbi:MAG: hypothetical protein FWC20_03175 [Oscillospiraceae bacterium]|nr:hypothetical protein [Oscillospiraceae bacterium]MCL2278394.1 hypothetical protein [Oscillospiraceae bacterium]